MHLVPQPLSTLLARLVHECTTDAKAPIFDLPRHRFYPGSPVDLSVSLHGRRAANPIGPAAGPHTQLAQNLVLSWLGGARVMELKTVQINDTLDIPRPCIDAENVGYNVEWSQELRLPESLFEYAKGFLLLAALRKLNPQGLRAAELDTLFDISVGYSLDGIRSPQVANWLDTMRSARSLLVQLRDEVPSELRRHLPDELPDELSGCVTLSTFHGCPPDEIERIVLHLFARHQMDVVVKLNPTLLGFDRVSDLLHQRLGYSELQLDPHAFESDLRWSDALAMIARLKTAAQRAGCRLGVKFSNTLVVKNHKQFFPATEKLMYLSGQPLHVLAISLAAEFAQATDGQVPISFSGGIDQKNCADVVACGLLPVTVCTDLLRPGGYGRMAKYLEPLPAKFAQAGATTIAELVEKNGGMAKCLADYAQKVVADPRYAAAKNQGRPRRVDSKLWMFDCLSCDKCIAVCPNDANFAVNTPQVDPIPVSDVVLRDIGTLVHEPADPFALRENVQIANFADACNECGNCDIFCPEWGGPYKLKPRFFSSLQSYQVAHMQDGFVVSAGRIQGRISGVEHTLVFGDTSDVFDDGEIAVSVGKTGSLESAQIVGKPSVGHRLRLWNYHAMRTLYHALSQSSNFVSASTLSPVRR
ncbi:MAG TPA: glutamate synthase [Pseudomonadota bacterium]|nr:glutamate synthase [Pseudomonadota bacterium]